MDKKITVFDEINEMMSKGLMSESLSIKHESVDVGDGSEWVRVSVIDTAKEAIKRKEETRMVRAKND